MDLRHRITIRDYAIVTDPDTGYETQGWDDVLTDEPASFLPGPGREYLAGAATRDATTGRFTIRWSPVASQVTGKAQVVWDGKTYNLTAPPMPDETARRTLTLFVSEAA